MPELPEVETVRAGLAARVVGRTVADVDVLHPRAVRRQAGGAAELVARVRGRTVTAAVRRGKYLWLTLGTDAAAPPDEALLAHLGMSGQLLVQEPDEARDGGVGAPDGSAVAAFLAPPGERPVDLTATQPPTLVRTIPATTAHLRVRLRFADGGQLWFVDQRTFGHLMAATTVPTDDGAPGGYGSDAPVLPGPVAHIARDLLDPALDRTALVRRTRARVTEVKRALLDQGLVSGVGNIYADEALWRSRLHGTRRTDRLPVAGLRTLFDDAAAVMREALAVGGTSFDALYVDVEGAAGYFARSLAVYGRAGMPCPRCSAPVRREQFMNRSSYSCPRCQRRPPV
ncbi:bifunctional DNA-formamidopyrimidine glycosylase/DNA-(apurinic or apyrimidinic site) lyase [Georgenia yuyongxinii]|uniref:Bifunctional DNA-formamidopyrimidine glycosylase/DNA-(Apurinic or apyrimidinic site) lyase n=1 Tax=Georgenia yuyongxinii TaxID=2589797 RepID=A0A5B8C762_9MICO|nr:bifunctional DNA-formamidopyrimidine glycosylase/DNA-(apurinic or apyrimidinic site) lyase [Georgenia yuyongxinii]QDC25271.1 bifunctional DNA-formamidopyrimidine glycosylase/DNA-(apurinic or apyrimidinic site) lyase [Georgenia yuyongxinii]